MSKFYTFISDGVATSKLKMNEEFLSSSFLFIPYISAAMHNDVVSGTFFSPKDVYWHDPTGCVDKTKEVFLQRISMKMTNCLPCKALSTIYPSLHDFFVNVCGVCEIPPFRSYLQILLQLSAVALPSQAAYSVSALRPKIQVANYNGYHEGVTIIFFKYLFDDASCSVLFSRITF